MATKPTQIDGTVPVIPTTFRQDESIDLEAVASCVRFSADCGVTAVCLPAYGSEFYKLSEAERFQVLEAAVGAGDRVLVIGQSNHPATIRAIEIAKKNEALGADIISFALPRLFTLTDEDLLKYSEAICSAVKVPVLIQDFNPGGATIGADFCRRLADVCDNFRYVKLEEPMMGPKLTAIREATDDRIGVLEGWGALYMMELIPLGICGTMPGVGMADLLQQAWRLAKSGDEEQAVAIYEKVLPQIVFSLQNFELFAQVEKDLLARRGVIPKESAYSRSATYTPDEHSWQYAQKLNTRIAEYAKQMAK
ncbi:MAG: dihydrodipicolinate synthase family protein [Planctomycetes bacterium]|nr:dihydrodipicolinate synthase family protein [Planctomycetota bacterium]